MRTPLQRPSPRALTAPSCLAASPTGTELAKLAAQYSDGIILGSDEINPELAAHVKGLGVPVLDFDKEMYSSDLYADKYNAFYDEILK